ncbi:MAG TPA: pantetheine-phosphate adenylyltransferase [Armatimonadota bacterium]|jgi:pantetheine-phosphate adenylyltransferase
MSTTVREHLAICPGSFDPLTEGHLDIIRRAACLFGRVIVAVGVDADKQPLFTVEERMDMAREACADLPNVEVASFRGLVVQYAREQGAVALVRGLRAISDFEREVQMALMNRKLAEEIHTVFLVTHPDYAFLSSSLVKEIHRLGGEIEDLVPPNVVARLREKLPPAG